MAASAPQLTFREVLRIRSVRRLCLAQVRRRQFPLSRARTNGFPAASFALPFGDVPFLHEHELFLDSEHLFQNGNDRRVTSLSHLGRARSVWGSAKRVLTVRL